MYPGIPYGVGVVSNAVPTNTALTAATHKWACSFTTEEAKTLSSVLVLQGSGSSGIAMVWSLHADAVVSPGGDPGTVLIAETAFTSTGAVTSLPISYACAANTRYWVVIRNTTATSVSYSHISSAVGNQHLGWNKRQDLGVGNWGTGKVDSGGSWVAVFADGTVLGLPLANTSITGNANVKAYGSGVANAGAQFTSPANVYLNVRGMAAFFFAAGTGTHGNPVGKLYLGERLIAETASAVNQSNVDWLYVSIHAKFPEPVGIPPNSDVRAMWTTDAGSSSVYLRHSAWVVDTSTAALLKHRPMNGTYRQASLLSGVWSFVDNHLPYNWLILDHNQPMTPAPLNRRQFHTQR